MKAQAWLDAQPVVVVEDESTRPTKKVHVPILADLPTLAAGSGEYVIPPSPVAGPKGQAFRFKHMPVTEEDYLRAADRAALALEKSRSWLNLIPEIEAQTITPAITPKQGHISMLVTAGLLGTTLVTHNGFPLLLKGGTEKYTVKIDEDSEEEEIEYDPDDPEKKKSLFRVRVEERSRPTLWTLDANGNFTFSNDPVKISDTLRIHVAELAQRVLGRNVPRYDLKPQAWEWQVFDPLSQGRYLPGRKETGLTDFQKHLSVALGRLLLGTGSGLINAEMGAGKVDHQLGCGGIPDLGICPTGFNENRLPHPDRWPWHRHRRPELAEGNARSRSRRDAESHRVCRPPGSQTGQGGGLAGVYRRQAG